MKCEVCQERLEEYLDGELAAVEQEQINAHLITCAECSACFSTLTVARETRASTRHTEPQRPRRNAEPKKDQF